MKKPDSFFIIISLIILTGLLSLYSASYYDRGVFMRQLLWVTLGLACFFVTSRFSYHYLKSIVWFLYGITLTLLILVLILGAVRFGAQRWLKIWWLNFQPSELAKLSTVLVLANYFSRRSSYELGAYRQDTGLVKSIIIPFSFVTLLVFPILEQPDLGTACMLILIFFTMLFISRVRLKYVIYLVSAGIILSPILWHLLRDYQKDRLLVFLNPNIDPLGAGYTIIQSKIAIGSGGFLGKGWLKGTQGQLHFLPEGHTDFIFATFAEEWGFFGTVTVMFLYYFLIVKCLKNSFATHDEFARFVGLGISVSLAMQIIINIAMTLGLCPVVGLPLPLISYGGSSIIVTMISLGIIKNISSARRML